MLKEPLTGMNAALCSRPHSKGVPAFAPADTRRDKTEEEDGQGYTRSEGIGHQKEDQGP